MRATQASAWRAEADGAVSTPDVVHVVCTDAFAGVESYVAGVATEQARRGLAVHVLGGSSSRMPAELAGTGVRWDAAPTPLAALRRLRELPGARCVHAHMTAAETAAVIASRGPVVSTRHLALRRGSTAAMRAVGRRVSRRLAGQHAISSYVAAAVGEPCTVVLPGVEVHHERRSVVRDRVVLVAQRLEPEKRTDVALRAWASSDLARRGWRLVVVGDGSQREELEHLAVERGIGDSCTFLGHRTDVRDLMASAGVFLAPCPVEGFGLAVVEAMAAGTPVVAASGCGHDETVGLAEPTYLLPVEDHAAIGSALVELAEDARRRAAYGEALKDVQRAHLTVTAHVDGLETFYRAVLP